MKVLVVGQGGREHALVRALKLSPSVDQVHAFPGSAGMGEEAKCHAGSVTDATLMIAIVEREKIDLVVVGPEIPLIAGVTDRLRERGIAVVGPSQKAAQLEGSKIFCKDFLGEAGVKTARSFVVSTVEQTRDATKNFQPPYVLKADGLAAGKGVFICHTLEELLEEAKSIFVDRTLGEAGTRALLEEFQPGYEISYLILTNGKDFEPLPLAQDHKRLLDGDLGPNTGGMGAIAPLKISPELRRTIDEQIVRPTLAGFQKRDFYYRGVLFIGLMITAEGPSVLEFNTRFGDPETQAILPLLQGDWGRTFSELSAGRLERLSWKNQASCCVVLAAEGYPDAPIKGAEIDGLGADKNASSYVLHAGVELKNNRWLVSGGRVVNAVGVSESLPQAITEAYAAAQKISFKGQQLRRDIGAKV